MSRDALASDLAFRLAACSELQHELQRRVSILRDAQRQLAIGRAPATVIALVAEHEPALAAELAAITEGENGQAD